MEMGRSNVFDSLSPSENPPEIVTVPVIDQSSDPSAKPGASIVLFEL